jgi:integrase
MHKYVKADAPALYSFELGLMLRALDITLRHRPQRKTPVNINMIRQLVSACDSLDTLGCVLKVFILFAFMAFLRQSNLAPQRPQDFDNTRHTCRGDIFIQDPGLIILIKWSKTHQTGETTPTIPLPKIHGSPLCPVRAFKAMVSNIPAPPHRPLLLWPSPMNGSRIATCRQIARIFQTLLKELGYKTSDFSLHALRRGGASHCFQAGAPSRDVQAHGCWQSDAFWSYIVPDHNRSSIIKAFKLTV